MKKASFAAVVSLVLAGTASAAPGSEGTSTPETFLPWETKPLKAVTFIIDTKGDPSLKSISLSTIRKIYDCTLRSWKDVPGSERTDAIHALALWEKDQATQLLQRLIPKFKIGSCVNVVRGADPSAAAYYTIGPVRPNSFGAKEMEGLIGYLNYGQTRAGQTPLAIIDDLHKKKRATAVTPSEESLKNRSYPLVP